MKKLRLMSILIGNIVLSGCVSRPPTQAEWPTNIPPREFFVAHYQADIENQRYETLDEYLLWVIRFYEGSEFYNRGWVKVTNDSLHGVKNPVAAEEIKTKMDLIGQEIACEWPKNKKDRRIFTRHIVVWGNALVEAIKRDQEIPLINRVLDDVNGLMRNRVAVEDIKSDRYFPRDKGDDVFM